MYVCVGTGTTAITPATGFPTIQGQTVVDGSVTWACLGTWISYFTSATPSWNPLSVTARYAVIYDVTRSGTLIALIDTGSSQVLTGPFALQPDPNVGWVFLSG